jgi:hypothetical protein
MVPGEEESDLDVGLIAAPKRTKLHRLTESTDYEIPLEHTDAAKRTEFQKELTPRTDTELTQLTVGRPLTRQNKTFSMSHRQYPECLRFFEAASSFSMAFRRASCSACQGAGRPIARA